MTVYLLWYGEGLEGVITDKDLALRWADANRYHCFTTHTVDENVQTIEATLAKKEERERRPHSRLD